MKIMVKLAVLFATLLLVAGAAFAFNGGCDCYEINFTNLDDPNQVPEPSFVKICYSGYPVGTIQGLCSSCYLTDPLYMFFDPMREQALTSHEACVAYLKFHGDDQYVLTGLVFGGAIYRYTIRGHKTDDAFCNCTNGSSLT